MQGFFAKLVYENSNDIISQSPSSPVFRVIEEDWYSRLWIPILVVLLGNLFLYILINIFLNRENLLHQFKLEHLKTVLDREAVRTRTLLQNGESRASLEAGLQAYGADMMLLDRDATQMREAIVAINQLYDNERRIEEDIKKNFLSIPSSSLKQELENFFEVMGEMGRKLENITADLNNAGQRWDKEPGASGMKEKFPGLHSETVKLIQAIEFSIDAANKCAGDPYNEMQLGRENYLVHLFKAIFKTY